MPENAFIQAIAAAVVQQLQASGFVQVGGHPAQPAPSYPPPAPAPQQAAPVAAPAPSFPPVAAPAFPPVQAAPAMPFHDNASASTWATDIYQAIGAVAPDNAMPEITNLMQQLAIADFGNLTPDKYPLLHQIGQALKAKYGIA